MEENITSALHGLLYLCVFAFYMYLFIYNIFISLSLWVIKIDLAVF